MRVDITYLEMRSPPARASAPVGDARIRRVSPPSVELYRELYDRVGRQWHWVDRKKLPDAELARIIEHPQVEVHILEVAGEMAGYAELDRRVRDEIEICYFGLFEEFIGRGLGRWFLDRVVDLAWSYSPARVWLHTCTLDHPRALPNYIAAGFSPYKVESIDKDVPG